MHILHIMLFVIYSIYVLCMYALYVYAWHSVKFTFQIKDEFLRCILYNIWTYLH